MAFQILALNTEKAHNLKEKSLEVIRMYRGLTENEPRKGEQDYVFQFEAPHLITLGLLYEQNKRFAGGAFAPLLKRVDGFLSGSFPKTLPQREERAEKVRAADEALGKVVAALKKRGINHPYREELRAGPHHAPYARAQDAAVLRRRPSPSCGRTSRTSTRPRCATTRSSARPCFAAPAAGD